MKERYLLMKSIRENELFVCRQYFDGWKVIKSNQINLKEEKNSQENLHFANFFNKIFIIN